MKFHVQKEVKVKLENKEKDAIKKLVHYLESKDKVKEDLLYEEFYNIARSCDLEPKDFFKVCYKVLINKERGPKLAGFIVTLGKERVLDLLKKV